MTMSFGGFGLDYTVVGHVRENVLDYLDACLEGPVRNALRSVELLDPLLHGHLNRVGRHLPKTSGHGRLQSDSVA